jgi:putative nucleotidyltransferase with HDIG domain
VSPETTTDLPGYVQRCPPLAELPPVVALVLQRIAEPETARLTIARLISRDPPLSVGVLTFTNCLLGSPEEEVDTLRGAIALLGPSGLRSAVLAASLRRLHLELARADVRLWQHAAGCGVAAATLARQTGGLPVPEAFLAGVLHDVGRLLMEAVDVARHRAVRRSVHADARGSVEVEREMFGFDHAEIGLELLRRWPVSERLAHAISAHHCLERAGAVDGAEPLAALIQLADRLCLRDGVGRPKPEPELDVAACPGAEVLGLSAGDFEELGELFRRAWAEDCATLS